MNAICVSRALKVRRHVEAGLPPDFPASSRQALEHLSPRTLARLHSSVNPLRRVDDPGLVAWLTAHPVPAPIVGAGHPLFRGTLVFVQLTFDRPGVAPFAMNAADLQTAISYSTQAVVPIQQYASQYGRNEVLVSPTLLSHTVTLGGNTFDDDDLQGWVDDIVRINGLSDACVMVLHDSVTAGGPVNNDAKGGVLGYHFNTGDGKPYCFCRVFGTGLTIADPTNRYAEVLSHEIAEMVVDPRANLENPEVCDACAGNCSNDRFCLFDSNNQFVGGTTSPATTTTPFTYFVNSVIKPEFYDPDTECRVKGSDAETVCVYPPPSLWQGPGRLTTVAGVRAVAGHFATGDGRHLVLTGSTAGTVHEIFWKPAQVGIEGEDDLPVPFGGGGIADVGSMYNTEEQRHVALIGTTGGAVHEIFWRADTVGVEGDDDLPVAFDAGGIVAVSGHYAPDQRRYVVIVATTAGQVHEVFWKSDTVGVEGTDVLPVGFGANGIVDAALFYDTDERRNIALVATPSGRVHEIFWQEFTVGIEGHDDLPLDFGAGGIVAVSGFYDPGRRRIVAVVGTTDGKVHQVYWKSLTVGIEAHSVIAQYPAGSVVDVAGFFSASDQVEHVVVALANGVVEEAWLPASV
jgi:hypothetical protein